MIFPAPAPRAVALSQRRTHLCAALFFIFAASFNTSAFAARDELPRGIWIERQTGLVLEIKSKNTILLFSETNSTEFEVVFTPEALVRDEYWMSIKSMQEKPHEIKIAPPKKPIAIQSEKPGEKVEPAPTGPPAKSPEPLRLDWLAPDHKMILSFLMQIPEPVPSADKKKSATPEATKTESGGENKTAAPNSPAPGTRGSQQPAAKVLTPVPVLEVLVFKQGELMRELIFDRAP